MHAQPWKKFQKKLFDEIKGRIKLDDESLPYKDYNYEYWTKTTTKGNCFIKLRKKIGSSKIEEIWNGDKEKEKLKKGLMQKLLSGEVRFKEFSDEWEEVRDWGRLEKHIMA